MKTNYFVLMILSLMLCVVSTYAQETVIVVDPTKKAAGTKLSKADEAIFNKALPRVRKQLGSEAACDESVEVAGVVQGAFSKAGAKQTLVFYQYCQTGNGLGWVGIVLIESGKVVGNYLADTGWSLDAGALPDINQNGLDEFTLSYGGGMHQGEGGVGVDVMEFSSGLPKGLGWFQAEKFTDTETTAVWKVTAKPGKTPIYYKQKYLALEGEKYRRSGANLAFKPTKAVSKFEVVK